jgi:hypothetical protein
VGDAGVRNSGGSCRDVDWTRGGAFDAVVTTKVVVVALAAADARPDGD